jgi:hypothetical protein
MPSSIPSLQKRSKPKRSCWAYLRDNRVMQNSPDGERKPFCYLRKLFFCHVTNLGKWSVGRWWTNKKLGPDIPNGKASIPKEYAITIVHMLWSTRKQILMILITWIKPWAMCWEQLFQYSKSWFSTLLEPLESARTLETNEVFTIHRFD